MHLGSVDLITTLLLVDPVTTLLLVDPVTTLLFVDPVTNPVHFIPSSCVLTPAADVRPLRVAFTVICTGTGTGVQVHSLGLQHSKRQNWTMKIQYCRIKHHKLFKLEDTARYAGLLIDPAEGFGQTNSVLCCFGCL